MKEQQLDEKGKESLDQWPNEHNLDELVASFNDLMAEKNQKEFVESANAAMSSGKPSVLTMKFGQVRADRNYIRICEMNQDPITKDLSTFNQI